MVSDPFRTRQKWQSKDGAMRTAVGYIRVSTEEQSREGVSLEMQVVKIRQYCELNDLTLLGIYGDPGISGKSIKARPGVQAVLSLVSRKRIHDVVVYKLDRLARNTLETLQMVEAIDKKGVGLHSISERLDTQSSIGRFVVRTLASLAEMERDQISERTTAAMHQKRTKGERISGQPPYGYRFRNGMIESDDQEQTTIRRIQILSEYGYSLRKISEQLANEGLFNREEKPFGVAALHKILKAA